MNYKNKPSLFKRESFYIILFLVLAIVVTIIAIAVRNSSNQGESQVSGNTTSNSSAIASANKPDLSSNLEVQEQQGPPNTLEVNSDNVGSDVATNSSSDDNVVEGTNDTTALDVTPPDDSELSANDTVSSDDVSIDGDDYAEQDMAVDSSNASDEQVATTLPFGFLKPLAGEITTNFDKLIQGTTSNGNQWITFSNGIEISASVGAPVIAAADGQVLSITQDLNGAIVTIDHGDGFETVYKNLDLACLLVNVGDTVTQNQQIGNIGEVDDIHVDKGPRLCFELIRNGEYQDPLKYIRY